MPRFSRLGTRSTVLGVATLIALASVGSSCNFDPVHSDFVDVLGPEAANLYPTESAYHRPGEPCGLCHSNKGPADSTFALGGTIFWGPDNYDQRADNTYVRIVDANGAQRCFVTNCNGNFYVKTEDFVKITYPLLLSVERTVDPGKNEGTLQIRRMSSHVGREGSCAVCHIQGLRDFASPGQVRMFNTEQEFKDKKIPLVSCPPPPGYVPVTQCPEDRR